MSTPIPVRTERINARLHTTRHPSSSRTVLLSIFLLMGANVFQFFPMLVHVREGWYVISFFYCFGVAFLFRLMSPRQNISAYEIYLVLVITLMPWISAVSAKQIFGQPLIPGVLAHRGMVTYASGIALLYWVQTLRTVSLAELKRSLIVTGWFCFFLYLSISMLMDPAKYAGNRGFIEGGAIEPYQFIFKSPFISLLIIYYFVLAFGRRSISWLILTLPLFYHLVFVDGGRSQFLSLMTVLILLTARLLPLKQLIIWALPATLLASLVGGSVYHFKTEEIQYEAKKLTAAIHVVVTGKPSTDASANARIREQAAALPYIKDHFLFGNGLLSAQWKGGYFGALGPFAPSDIGIFGLFFVFGIFGALVFYSQFLFAIHVIRKLNRQVRAGRIEHVEFYTALKYFILFLFIDSLATGRVVFAGSVSFLFISMLYCLQENPYRLNRVRPR